jgi:hypothetical protein
MKLCEDLSIDPENVSRRREDVAHGADAAQDLVMFCLATDLGSKSLGEWSRDEWIKGWKSISPK